LLKALLCCPGRQARRETLLELLWPDADPEQATQSLNTAVTRLRKMLAPGKGQASVLITDEDSHVYRLAEQSLLCVDADAALLLLGEAERRGRTSPEALSLLEEAQTYLSKGMILQDEEGHWAAGRRATVEQARYRCRLWLAEAYEQHQMPGQAATILSQILEEDPIDEDVLARLMLLLHRQSMTQQALRLYERACEVAAREEVEFTEATRKLAAQLATGDRRISTGDFLTSPSAPILLSSLQHDLPPDFSQDVMETIRELERTAGDLRVSDIAKRRAVIAHLLGIPPTLFSSDRYAVSSVTDAMKLQEETLSALYEDLLIMGWDSFRRSKSPQIITKIDEHVTKLTALTRSASIGDEAHWQSLLCRFSQLSTRVAQHRLDEPRALQMAKQAIMIAIDLDDAELIASTFYGRGRVHLEYSHTTMDGEQKKRHFERAKADIDAALGHVERVRPPLAGNIYLLAAEIYALIADNDMVLRTQCERWQDKVAWLVESEKIEDDGTFLKLNPTALHHERAKILLRFGKIEEARRELDTAWKTLQPNLFTWQMNMHLTQATLCLAEQDIEASAKSNLKAYTLAKVIHSHKGEVEVQRLLEPLQHVGKANASVRELTMTVGSKR